ncbi:MAG: ATP-dependent Clp protease proteolytic subunit, partial [Firmicutes bacterium]|nr:ATP-dependent Clp protease proteolytic subunit [Bacillota bacterium]
GAKGKRMALPSARIMIHQPLGGAKGQATDIELEAKEILRMKDMLIGIMAENSGQSFEKVKDDCERDITLECKVIYKQKQDSAAISEADKSDFYSDEDYHIYYFAEVVGAYIVE